MAGFDKQSLLNLMSYPNEISDREVEELNEILADYPYFQLGHSLIAKAKHDKQTPDAHQALTHAAIYAPNRSLLRSLFYEDLKIDYSGASSITEDGILTHDSHDTPNTNDTTAEEDVPEAGEDTSLHAPENYDPPMDQEDTSVDNEQVIESDEVYNELEENLRKLRESKNQFSDEDDEEHKKKIADQSEPSDNGPSKNSREQEPGIAPLLMELVESQDEENHTLSYGNREQNELIDRFINSNQEGRLQLQSTDKEASEDNDLSLDSVHVSDDLITENLADIYRRQGKKEKAIEIYHKLIWKFPHKKAYFAEIIENLKAE